MNEKMTTPTNLDENMTTPTNLDEKLQVQLRGLHPILDKMCKYWRDMCKFGGICAKIPKNVQNDVQIWRDGAGCFSLFYIKFALKTGLFEHKAGWRDGKSQVHLYLV